MIYKKLHKKTKDRTTRTPLKTGFELSLFCISYCLVLIFPMFCFKLINCLMSKEKYISWSHNNNNLKCTSKNSSKKENGAVAGLFYTRLDSYKELKGNDE